MQIQYTKNGTKKQGTVIRLEGLSLVVTNGTAHGQSGLQSKGTELVFQHECATEEWNRAYHALGGQPLYDEDGEMVIG